MTRENARDLLPVIQAYADGKVIQIKNCDGTWEDAWADAGNLTFTNPPDCYRIKPEETYRPYESLDEMIADFKNRFCVIVPPEAMPWMWVKNVDTNLKQLIVGFDEDNDRMQNVYIGMVWYNLQALFAGFTYLDGTPCGVKE